MKIKFVILVFAIAMGFTLTSCSSNDDGDDRQKSEFQGEWTGTFTGNQESGSWTASIDSDGNVTGTTTSTVYTVSLQLKGKVSSGGAFTATAGTASNGAEFTGNLKGSTGSGTWVNEFAGLSGTWVGNKK